MTLEQKLELLKAAKEGKPIQYRPLKGRRGHTPRWLDNPANPHSFNFEFFEYRIKPEGDPNFFWTNRYHDKHGFFTMGYFQTQDEARFYACPLRPHKTIKLPVSQFNKPTP